MITVSVFNQKGGCGKTTTSAALAAGLARRGFKVLAVDTDGQHSLTKICAPGELAFTLSDVIRGRAHTATAILAIKQQFDIIPGDLTMSDLPSGYKLETLRGILNEVADRYDFCVVDTPPALSIITMSALVASSVAIIPATPDVLNLYGIDQAAETIEAIRPYNVALRASILLTQYNDRRNLDRAMKDAIKVRAQAMGATVYETKIRAGVSIPEAHLLKQDIFSYSPRAGVTSDYNAFICEFLKGVNNG